MLIISCKRSHEICHSEISVRVEGDEEGYDEPHPTYCERAKQQVIATKAKCPAPDLRAQIQCGPGRSFVVPGRAVILTVLNHSRPWIPSLRSIKTKPSTHTSVGVAYSRFRPTDPRGTLSSLLINEVYHIPGNFDHHSAPIKVTLIYLQVYSPPSFSALQVVSPRPLVQPIR